MGMDVRVVESRSLVPKPLLRAVEEPEARHETDLEQEHRDDGSDYAPLRAADVALGIRCACWLRSREKRRVQISGNYMK
jgi:hypothetical protein